MPRTRLCLWLLWSVACGAPSAPRARPATTSALTAAGTIAARPSPEKAPAGPTPWIEDDYARALETAKKERLPLLVDASAVWCHTCRAMRAFVLDDASLPGGFVRLSFDVEKDQNAAAAAAFPTHVLPTFFVVDPADGAIHGRWEGAGSVPQMRAFMRDAARSIELAHTNELAPDDPLALLLAGHRAALAGDARKSADAFSRALAKAPAAWEHAPEALLGLLKAQRHTGGPCAESAVAALTESPSRLGDTSVMADFASEALDCVEGSKDAAAVKLRQLVASEVARVARDASAPLSPDDRADAWKVVWDAREALGDRAGALEAARARLDVIEKAVAARPEPEWTTTFDGARMETLEFLGRGEDAASFLSAQEKALPGDYDPPHRLAHVYFKLKRYPEALAAVERALAKGYGARKGLMYRLEADILAAMGRKADARAALEKQLALYRSLPASQKKPGYEKAVQEQIDDLK